MIVLHKKRLILVFSIIFISLFAFYMQTSNKNISNFVETVALPVSNKTIILDAGHGKPDERC